MKVPYRFEAITLSGLEKPLPGQRLAGPRYECGTMLRGERFHYQVALRAITDDKVILKLEVDSPIKEWVRVYKIGNVPVELTHLPQNDPRDVNFLSLEPGLYPDLLSDIPPVGLSITPKIWNGVWVTLNPDAKDEMAPGKYPISLNFSLNGEVVTHSRFEIEVLDVLLPPQEMVYTNWFHMDCLATYYKVDIFSPRHWEITENFLRMAVSRGMNMVLTPCMTPPLDTGVGHERPTVQLVDVTLEAGEYRFGFNKLEQFVLMAKRCGVTGFSIRKLAFGLFSSPTA